MYSEPSKFERPSLHLSLDSFHDAEGLPISGPFDSRPERPKIATGDEDDDDPRASNFASPDLDQKLSQHLLDADQSHQLTQHNVPKFDFYRPGVPSPYDIEDLSMSPAAMFLSSFSPASVPARSPDAEGEHVSGYKLGPVIAYGGFSTIRRASSSSGGIVAVKIVRRSDLAQQQDPALARKRLDHEASVWLSLSHEHILPLFSAVHTSYADFFVTLYCPAGSLFDIMKRDGRPAFAQDDAGMMFRQVVRGLRYLHEVARLVHRDVKLENVLVDEMGVCRIGDFGMSRNIGEIDADDEDLLEMQRHMDDEQLRTQSPCGEHRTTFAQAKRQTKVGLPVHLSMIRHHSGTRHRNSTPMGNSSAAARPSHVFQTGSLPYAAPELLMPQFSTPARVDPAQDIWALGVMLYAMLTGRLPFVDTFDPRLQMKILHGAYDVPADIGRGAELVLQGCIERSTSSRWTIAMVDEVAWGVGWGTDDSSAPHDENSAMSGELSPSFEAARRRSNSRARRSLSREPTFVDRSSSRSTSTRDTSRNATRSSSRHSPRSHSTLADSVISSTASDSSVPFDRHQDPTLHTLSAPSRGRRAQRAHSGSASRSPSPQTPTDFVAGVMGHPLDDVIEDEPLRGRTSVRGIVTPRPTDVHFHQSLDVVDETSRSTSDPEKSGIFSELLRRLNPLT